MFDSFDEIPSLFITEDTEFFPLMSNDEEEEINKEPIPDILPILPLRNTVLFPGVIIPITVGRDKSIKLIREARSEEHTSELQSLMRLSYAVFCLKKKNKLANLEHTHNRSPLKINIL